MREWAQVIDANPAGDALWYEFWSLDRQERFSLKIKDGKALSIGNIVRVEEEAGRPALKALEFTSVPLKFRDKTLVDAVSFKPKGKNGFEPGRSFGLSSQEKVHDVYPGGSVKEATT